jgi:hypothetical protein
VIAFLLMLVYPGPALAGPAQAPAQRASDADRDIAADILCAAVGDGRLTLGELDDRLGAALSARTTTELAALIADLTGRPSARATGPAGATRVPSGAPTPSRWALIQSLCPDAGPTPGWPEAQRQVAGRGGQGGS